MARSRYNWPYLTSFWRVYPPRIFAMFWYLPARKRCFWVERAPSWFFYFTTAEYSKIDLQMSKSSVFTPIFFSEIRPLLIGGNKFDHYWGKQIWHLVLKTLQTKFKTCWGSPRLVQNGFWKNTPFLQKNCLVFHYPRWPPPHFTDFFFATFSQTQNVKWQ